MGDRTQHERNAQRDEQGEFEAGHRRLGGMAEIIPTAPVAPG
jgi:hypothetical protein